MRFEPKNVDFDLSPYTGLTRDSWIEAGKHLLSGIFQHVKRFEDSLVMPRQETQITYPHASSSGNWRIIEEKAEIFEGLTRSLFIAAPLLKDDPELEICGYRMADYYKSHILRACTKGDPVSVGNYDEILELAGSSDRTRTFQQTVETCALVIGLNICHEVIWDTYVREEKERIAGFLASYAHAGTVPQNWRFFNMLDMAFLHMNGYEIDEEIMAEHAAAVINYYVGDGWYRDGQCFDYYSCWAFNVYGPLWNLWYGYEKMPAVAAQIEEHSRKLMETYPDFFDEDGWTNMWGRSNVYRFAATSPLGAFAMFDEYRKCDENVFGNDVNREDIIKSEINGKDANGKKVRSDRGHNYGLFRRICSGSLLQFITREDFYYRGFPTMGFYGMFAPLVQGYSCAESPFWLGKAFLCLELPADHPFWTEKESNGTWEELEPGEVKVTTLDGPALAFSNHKANGSTILRTGKVVKRAGDLHGMWNYSKLAYHSKYPWEATPHVISGENGDGHGDDHDDSHGSKNDLNSEHAFEEGRNSGKEDNPESMQYVLTDLSDMHVERCNATFWCGMKDSQTINSKCKGKPLCHADRNDEDPQGIQIKEKDEVLYRRQFFNYSLDKETHWMQAIDLADFTVPYGIMRVDRIRLFKWPVVLTLGAFGFPDNGTEIIRKYQFTNDSEVIENSNRPDNCKATKGEDGLKASAVILKGTDSQGRKKQLAMTIYDGWDDLLTVRSEHTNPDSEKSVIVYAKTTRKKQYGGAEPHILISQVITKENHEDFQHDELFPIKEIRYSDPLNSGACGTIRILLKDGNVKMIDFTGNEGSMSL